MNGRLSSLDRSYRHRGGSVPLIGRTIDAFFREICRRFPKQEAVVSIPQNRRLTYQELNGAVESMARGLMALGVKRGSRVGIWSTDNVEWIIIQLATARVGAVLININPAYRISELRHALTLARVQFLFLIPSFRSSNYVRMISEACGEAIEQDPHELHVTDLPELRRIVLYDPDRPVEALQAPHRAILTWKEVISGGEAITPTQLAELSATLEPDDPINIQFTSGTTGFPKAVVLTHHNILNNGYFIGEAMQLTERDRLCVPVPFYHCFGMVVSNLACLTHGAAIIIPAPHFEAGATLAAIASERCTAVHGVPTMFIAELERPDLHEYDLGSLRTGIMAGAPCPPVLLRRVMEEMGCREILIGYGQTEASPITHLTRPDDSVYRRTETVGTNMSYQEVKVIDIATGSTLPVDERGEVCIRGYNVMRGYFDQPEATREAIDEAGWLHTGDLGSMDRDGYLRITGRLRDMIIRGGENIYPAEVEAFFHEHPKIAQIAVVGVPDDVMGEEVGAWVILHEGSHADPDELRSWARERIAHYKVPRFIWIVDELPKTVTGKVQKFRIQEAVARGMVKEAAHRTPEMATASG